MPDITLPQFTTRFVSLILDARDVPKKPSDLRILLLSSILRLDPGSACSESELNDALQRWVLEFGGDLGLDHVSLRRALVDEGFVRRDPAGVVYHIEAEPRGASYDPAIRTLDLEQLIRDAKDDRERRKRLHARPPSG
jgi:hypothetical protein